MKTQALVLSSLLLAGCGGSSAPDGDADADADADADSDADGDADACDACSPDATCTGGACVCNDGYEGDGLDCQDADECAADNGGCDANAACTNVPGSRTCACNPGYSGDGEACVALWSTLQTIEGLDVSYPYVVGVEGIDVNGDPVHKIYFARGQDPAFFKSFDVDALVVGDETMPPDDANDFCACGYTARPVTDGGYIYVFGNFGQAYRTRFHTWSPLTYGIEDHRGEAATAMFGSSVAMVGGRAPDVVTITDSAIFYDVPTGAWSTGPSFPVAVGSASAVVVGDVLYVVGGVLDDNTTQSTTFAAYDPDAFGWALLDDAPLASGLNRAVAYRDQIWVTDQLYNVEHGVLRIYDPATVSWLADAVTLPSDGASWWPVVVAGELYLVAQLAEGFTIVQYVGP